MTHHLENFASEIDHSKSDSFVCVLLSHGANNEIIYTYDGEFSISIIISMFKRNQSLAGKPKLFFIQACRGSHCMESIDGSHGIELVTIPVEADFLVAYSTVAGYCSVRNTQHGSWFIQSLCKVIVEKGDKWEIMHIITEVNQRVAKKELQSTDQKFSEMKQVPCIVSTLTKQ